MRRLLVGILMVLLVPVFCFAGSDVIATYKYSDGSMVVLCTRDAEHVRMDTSPSSYLLLKAGKIYSVTRDDDGKVNVVNVEQAMSGGGSGGFTSLFGEGGSTYEVLYEELGYTEKFAGYEGEVYAAEVYDGGEYVSREEIVFSNHDNILKVADAWIAMSSQMTAISESFGDSIEEAKKLGYGGIIRYGEEMRLSKVAVKNLNSSFYDLPDGKQKVHQAPPPVQAQKPPQTQQPPAPPQYPDPPQNNGTGLEDDARDIAHDAKEATKDEIKSTIRGAIGDLFN